MIKKLDDIMIKLKNDTKMRLAVAAAEDKEVLHAVFDAKKENIIEPILVGDVEKIKKITEELGISLDDVEVISTSSLEESAKTAVKLVADKKADFVMKGLLDTSILLKSVLDKDYGLRTNSLLSHVMIYEIPAYHKLLILTDGGMNIAPTYEQKEKILMNSIQAARSLELDIVKVACLAAKEKVSPKMEATVDADKLSQAGKQGIFGENVIVEGPLAFDLAVSRESADVKKFESNVSGDVDILVVPTIEVGNGIGKALTYMANAKSAGIIMGAKAPVVLVSRADSHESKLYSIAYGALVANGMYNN